METLVNILRSILLAVCFIILFLGLPVIAVVSLLTEWKRFKPSDIADGYKEFFNLVRESYVNDVWGKR